jgi:hypothetical protein
MEIEMDDHLINNRKQNNYMNIINTLALCSMSIIIFFIYLSINQKLANVDKLVDFAEDFFKISNNYLVESKPEIDHLIYMSTNLANESFTTLYQIQDTINLVDADYDNVITDIDSILININTTVNIINNLLNIVYDESTNT